MFSTRFFLSPPSSSSPHSSSLTPNAAITTTPLGNSLRLNYCLAPEKVEGKSFPISRRMGTPNIKDVLTSFSPLLDYLAISTGDGRIKIWDTLKGQIQTEFADISSTDGDLYSNHGRGNLSVDYTCMKWLSLVKKKKRKLGGSLLVLGTGSGDVLAMDVSAGHLKWKASDCHPGGVSAISKSIHGSCIFTAGVDGMICKLDSMTGNLLGKFKASSKPISSMSVSSDEKILATGASQLKIFNCSNYKKIQKFSGHPGAVRCMIFTEDGKYILSSAVGEKNIAVWGIDSTKKQSASCVLAMEHPAVFLDSRSITKGENNEEGLYVVAISEMGVCYFWYGKNLDELRNTKPTKVSSSLEDISINQKGSLPTIFAAKLQGIVKPACAHVFITYGLLVKPLFQKILVQTGTDIKLVSSKDGVLLPKSQSHKAKKGLDTLSGVTALDRANAEDAVLPLPKIFDIHDKKKKDIDSSKEAADDSRVQVVESKDDIDKVEIDAVTFGMEDRLKSLGVLSSSDNLPSDAILSSMLKGIDLRANIPQKKMRAAVLSMETADAYKLLKVLVSLWHSRSCSAQHLLPWIFSILINHSHYVISQQPDQVLDPLYEICKSRGESIQSLLQLSGRLQLVMAQIDKAIHNKNQALSHDHQMDETDEEDEDVDEYFDNAEDDQSQISSDDDD